MRLRDVTRNAMVSALYGVRSYVNNERTDWYNVMESVEAALAEYEQDASRPEGGADFDGETYNPALDALRLNKQLGRVFEYMSSGNWVTLAELVRHCGGTTASVSARIRDLKKAKHGAWIVERRRRTQGVHEYQLRNPDGTPIPPLRPR